MEWAEGKERQTHSLPQWEVLFLFGNNLVGEGQRGGARGETLGIHFRHNLRQWLIEW